MMGAEAVPRDPLADGTEPSPLDPDGRVRLRGILGPPSSTDTPFVRRERTAPPAAAEPSEDVAFVLIDLERKIDKLLDSAHAVDQLTAQVRELNERLIHLERRLIGLT